MKMKHIALLLALFLAAAILPSVAAALTSGAPGLSDYTYGSGNRYQAKEYKIAFGTEPYLDGNSVWPVYSAPALDAVRGARGKASLATNGCLYRWLERCVADGALS